jgi:hypothetical protein
VRIMHYSYRNKNGETYYLHSTVVILRGGNREQTIYFFARNQRDGGVPTVPTGFQVVENTRTGLPVLKRVK